MHVVATAGHVDHGKSTLVRRLTGMEPDRWAEERRRGLTIDLGFAWTTLPDGAEVAFVDVPGHERFVPNMLAGVGPVPAVMIVVAADEGWMPQSAEHLAALDALGVRHGLLVVSRADLADQEPALAEASAHVMRTSLARAGPVPSVVVSGATGAGLDDLRAALSRLVAGLPVPDVAADLRLWVDRSFTIGGAGTVVTGTLPAGTLHAGDELVLASTGARLRVRGLQTTGRQVDTVTAVARVAVNLRGVDRRAIARGDALLTPDAWLPTTMVDAALHASPSTDPPRHEMPTHLVLHVGSAAVPVRVRPLGQAVLRLTLSRPLPLRVGDRVLLRDPGRHHIVGGGTVLDTRPPILTRRGAAATRAIDLTTLADLAERATDTTDTTDTKAAAGPVALPAAATAQHLRHRGFVRGAELRAMGLPAPGRPIVGDWHAAPQAWRAALDRLRPALEEWHRAHPLDDGMPADVLRRRLGLPDQALLAPLTAQAGLVARDGRIHRPGSSTALPARLEAAVATVAAELARAPFAAPEAERLRQLGLGARELAAAERAGRLLRIADGVVLLPDAVQRATRTLAALPQPFTLSQARQALATTRRVAVPLLELMDRKRITERLPDSSRRLR
jgi:selenocysteine-specific elongation factor